VINSDIQRVYREISKLTTAEKVSLISMILPEISRELKKDMTLDIYDIKGLGKEIWKNIDAQDYINKERDLWE
jgi:hypothetical protein